MLKLFKIFFFIISSVLFLTSNIYSQTNDLKFKQFSIEQGLTYVTSDIIVQDGLGFLWIAHAYGLNRYDGYEFKFYHTGLLELPGLTDNEFECLYVDQDGDLWVGTRYGLNKYNKYLDNFQHFVHDPNNPNSICSNHISSICQDSSGFFWISSRSGGITRVDSNFESFEHYTPESITSEGLTEDIITTTYIDKSNILWIGTNHSGLIKYDIKHDKFSRIHHDSQNPGSIAFGHINLIIEDREKNLWIGIGENGLDRYNHKTDRFSHFRYDPKNPASLCNNVVHAVCEDSKGQLWIGTASGLQRYEKATNKFSKVYLKTKTIYSIYEDHSGVVWFGTEKNGIFKLDNENQQFPPPIFHETTYSVCEDSREVIWIVGGNGLYMYEDQTKSWLNYQINPDSEDGSRDNEISVVVEDSDGTLWIGAFLGLFEFDRNNKQFKKFKRIISDSSGQLGANPIIEINYELTQIIEDTNGILWIGTHDDGLYKFDRTSGNLKQYQHDPFDKYSLNNNYIRNMYLDELGTLWISAGGLHKYDSINDRFERFLFDPNNPKSLSHNMVACMHLSHTDPNNILWVGTIRGLDKFNKSTETFVHLTEKDGLPHNRIRGILEDSHHNLWVSTVYGLSKYDPKTNTFKNFYASDGLQGNIYWDCIKNKKGKMYLGGEQGLSVFHPDSIKDDPFIPPIVLTKFKKFNKEVELDSSITLTKQISLASHENVFSFEFAALSFTNPDKNQFAYQMQGIDRDWVSSGNKREVTYTHLPPGKYTFRVKGSNHDGVWNETGTSVRIIILPPWWQTTGAYVFYAVVIGIIIIGFWFLQVRRIRMKNRLVMSQFEAQKLQEVDQIKSRFFSNISHEFRTPLTLILGPLEKMFAETTSVKRKKIFRMMLQNGRQLLRLINQLLDISKLESGKMTLNARPVNIVKIVKLYVDLFMSVAEAKNIELQFRCKEKTLFAFVDSEKLEKIVSNLLSNALKFTPEFGKVSVTISLIDKKFFEIIVSDTGPGIGSEQLKHIFDRFYQVDSSKTREYAGTGIGLSLTKELVEIHGGQITVQSELAKGTTFKVRLPLGKEHFEEEHFSEEVHHLENKLPTNHDYVELLEKEDSVTHTKTVKTGTQFPIILIVEDNSNLRSYISDIFENNYRIEQASSGSEGFEKATETIPDLVISDVMMPGMDGFELCQKLKTDQRTSHIPVILLTARASRESKLEGLKIGADDYIAKPFEARELEIRVKNLIEQRQKIQEKFHNKNMLQPQKHVTSSMDKKFLDKAISIVEEHLSNEHFSVETFSKQIGMSRVQLHRKLKALTDYSASEFIRYLRLSRAASLLKQESGTVTEIAYEVGFSSLSYFSKCFRDHFGKLPSDYVSK